MSRNVMRVAVLVLAVGAAVRGRAQPNSELNRYFLQSVGLSQDQVAAIRGGQAVSAKMKSRIPDEVFVSGVVFVKATPESYVKLAYDFGRMAKVSGFLAVGKFSDPPRVSDLKGFSFDSEDIKALKDCKPANCQIQMPAGGIEALHNSVDLSAPDAGHKVDITYCIRSDDPKQPGFYLIMVMGSEQAGLTGFKGSIVRKAAVDRSASSLQKSLAAIKNTLENQ